MTYGAKTANELALIKVATGEYPPFTSKEVVHGGFVQHMVREAFKRKGFRVEYNYFPWARTLKETQKGNYHATAFWYYSKEREKSFIHSESLHSADIVFFHLKTTPFKSWDNLSDLKKYRIGASRSYTYTPEFWEAHKNKILNIRVSNSDEINFKMLFKKRIDLFPMATVAGYSLLYKTFSRELIATITYNYKPLFSSTNHLLFPKSRKDAKQLTNIFNQGLAEIKQDGFYEKYYDLLLEGYYEQQENITLP
ncbi:substrate-binding periplasmic protein [Spartinivicinus poritis]|uniref:Transporter substrate-binding domain-containing protein n=1 Tax=Spartinivicinus poritis TaxID=2994640 RepID=A0ABT5UD07_9GAMM|nr:transporter substrate-binding domain-containing protein [Spartinivicinus sp. A2-2]MDE1464256.1 transporter substrate-binding domain-containing protein [Spartinivicinus sp. A2-2]